MLPATTTKRYVSLLYTGTSDEPGKLLQCLCRDDSNVNVVMSIIITIIIIRCEASNVHDDKESRKLENWHSEECNLTPTLTFNLLTSNKMGDQDLSRTNHLPSLLMICPVVFVLDC